MSPGVGCQAWNRNPGWSQGSRSTRSFYIHTKLLPLHQNNQSSLQQNSFFQWLLKYSHIIKIHISLFLTLVDPFFSHFVSQIVAEMTKTSTAVLGRQWCCPACAESRVPAGLALSWPAAGTTKSQTSTALWTLPWEAHWWIMRCDCLGNRLQHCCKEYFWDEVYIRLLKNKIADPLLAVLISIKVAASQVEHILDPLHLLEGEEREQQAAWHRAEYGFLKVGMVLRNCKWASTKMCKAGNLDVSLSSGQGAGFVHPWWKEKLRTELDSQVLWGHVVVPADVIHHGDGWHRTQLLQIYVTGNRGNITGYVMPTKCYLFSLCLLWFFSTCHDIYGEMK